jgi:16S rRNA (cytidine1402-2'-O)-methyltransferase
MQQAAQLLGERQIVVARELTKVHQEFIRGSSAEIIGLLTNLKGEFTVVVGPNIERPRDSTDVSDRELLTEFGVMTESGALSRREVVTTLARKFGKSSRDIYAAVERAKESVE